MPTTPLLILLLAAVLCACQPKTSSTEQTDKQAKTDSVSTDKATKLEANENTKTANSDFLIIPGRQVGPIKSATSEAELIKLLGPSVVTAGDTLYGPEGAEFIGTTLYKDTSDEVQIIYTDEKRTKPETILIRPKLTDDEGEPLKNVMPTRWATVDGLRIGTTLKELEQRNGKPFKLWGFAWDYGGMVSNWQGGKLGLSNKKMFLAIGLGPSATQTPAQEKAYNKLMGDSEFLSSLAAMQVLNPVVQSMQVSF
ncbi:hypothetical protein [Spirosoma foliorum]|uniref:Uncharacterized protein n=1 Tax=Spirosoma foliorum TaxID=2710596 RepID=A0A7G5GVH7_9BACT|nr:hypothetical protein [Spirosoma foliorum]QMW02869.1 hypothetical protein H3H32_34090 [Spirosoma foliorum]